MTLWFVFALMTAAAIFAVLLPLGRRGQPQKDGSEAAVYTDQLIEIDRDVAAGLIGPAEAEAARVEISRRLLAAADHQRAPPIASSVSLRRSAAIVALVGLPITAAALYLEAVLQCMRALAASLTTETTHYVPYCLARAAMEAGSQAHCC